MEDSIQGICSAVGSETRDEDGSDAKLVWQFQILYVWTASTGSRAARVKRRPSTMSSWTASTMAAAVCHL